jgi:nucleoside-diphosphate-sugar epimerase
MMKVFVTGATGYIGNGVAKAFARAGHEVFGLVRSERGAKELQKSEICPLIGTIENLPKAAKEADAIVHCAYENPEKDLIAIDTLLHTFPKTFVYTSGVWLYGNRTQPVDETSSLEPLSIVTWRLPVEQKILKSKHKSIVIRPGHVYGYDKGLIAMIFEGASKGNLEIAGNGENHWAIVHLDDLAQLYLLAVEKSVSGVILNGTDDTSIKLKDLAESSAKLAHSKAHYLPYPEALKKFGSLAEGLAVNQPHISNKRATQLLGWHPRHNNLLSQIGHYWQTWLSFNN